MRQKILDEKNAQHCKNQKMQDKPPPHDAQHAPNIVKVVDKSYLEKKCCKDGASELVDSTVQDFSMNKEQEHAIHIIANHAISESPEQLCMYLGGMGGTGKTQVIKALSCFFKQRSEAHTCRFVIVAPMGTAAALLGGSTYHSAFGINDRSGIGRLGHIKEKLKGIEYVFFDEVSMLSAQDLYQINLQLSKKKKKYLILPMHSLVV